MGGGGCKGFSSGQRHAVLTVIVNDNFDLIDLLTKQAVTANLKKSESEVDHCTVRLQIVVIAVDRNIRYRYSDEAEELTGTFMMISN